MRKWDNGDLAERRIQALTTRVKYLKENDIYYFNQPISELRGGARVIVNGREMGMYASYSYLGLVGHPRINKGGHKAIDQYGTGTHGVRTLAGNLKIHEELDVTIAGFKNAEAAVTYTSSYVTNLTVISTLVGRGDYVFSDKINHASIVDGCIMSGAGFRRFRHNDIEALDRQLSKTPSNASKLIVADAVFSLDGDSIDFPKIVEISR